MPHPPLRLADEAVHGIVRPRRRPTTRKRSSGGEVMSAMSSTSGCSSSPTIVQISRHEATSRALMRSIRRLLITSLVVSLSMLGIRTLGWRASRDVYKPHGKASER